LARGAFEAARATRSNILSKHLTLASLIVATVALGSCGGSGGVGSPPAPPPPPPPTSSPIKHVVVIFQENRTPDNLFHGLPGADIATSGTNSQGQTIPLTMTDMVTSYDLGHRHADLAAMYDGGKMDGADKVSASCTLQPGGCPPNVQFQYVNPAQVLSYFQLAQRFTFGDRMFQTNQGPSFPAHQYIISGTSAPSSGGTYAGWFVSENPTPNGKPTGCVEAPANGLVALIAPNGVESTSIFPCFEHPTLIDLLDQAKLTWRYYAPSTGSIWTGPAAIKHLREGADWSNVVIPQTSVLNDIAAHNLAQVSWVIPNGEESDHALSTDGTGPSWVAAIVNAIGNSPYWADTAVVITWDDWGGWYDHVAPAVQNAYEYGFRVPLIVVSPYAKSAYVSHVKHDFGSILHFIETTFALPTLGYADARADDLSDCFDFIQMPISWVNVSAQVSAAQLVAQARSRPQTDPDDD
jgi:phospholipase C